MHRRHFLAASVIASASATGALAFQPSQKKSNSLVELRYYKLRNTTDAMAKRTNDFLAKSYLPALQRAGISKIGFFGNVIGEGSPLILQVSEYANFGQLESSWDKLSADKAYQSEAAAYEKVSLGYVRVESSLLRSFDGVPALEMPKQEAGRAPRVFELRSYESNSVGSLAKKVGMFNSGEVAIFRRTGLNPVFFGEMLYGSQSPNLVYMLWYDNWAAREANWKKFVSDPEWDKLKATPGLSDGEVVSNISNSILSATAYSPIR